MKWGEDFAQFSPEILLFSTIHFFVHRHRPFLQPSRGKTFFALFRKNWHIGSRPSGLCDKIKTNKCSENRPHSRRSEGQKVERGTEKYDYLKVILYGYPSLLALAEAAKRSAENRALLSFREPRGALEAAGRVTEDFALADALLGLHALVTRLLSHLSEEENFLLEYKYFRRREQLEGRYAGRRPACSERSYYRRQQSLLRRLGCVMALYGWSEEKLLACTGTLFLRPLAAIREGKEQSLLRKRRGGGLYQNPASSCSGTGGRFPLRTKTATASAAAQATTMTAISTPESPFSDG